MGNSLKIRQFTFCQYEFNPRTKEFLINFDDVIKNLRKYKSFTEWACCIHDKDVYTEDAIDKMRYTLEKEAKEAGITDEFLLNEYISKNSWAKLGEPKPKHIHVACKCTYAIKIEDISRFLGVEEYLIEKKKGKRAFLDCVKYLTHEDEKQQKLGKHRYDDSEVFTSENFTDWRERLDSRKIDEEKYGVGKNLKQKYIIDVSKYGMTLNQCFRELDGDEYIGMLGKLQKARQEYLIRNSLLPNTRLSIYVYGAGGTGKDVFCELLSHALYPETEDIRDISFGIGDGNSTFDGYDGQPVLTWSDVRAGHFFALGKRLTLTALDPHPKEQGGNVDIKFGNTRLINSYNIINGVENFFCFIQDMAERFREVGNIEQFYRRFPVVVFLTSKKFTVTVNSGIYFGNNCYGKYELYKEINGSFAELQKYCGSDKELLRNISAKAIAPVVDIIQEIRKKFDSPEISKEDTILHFDKCGFGDVITTGSKFEKYGDSSEYETLFE